MSHKVTDNTPQIVVKVNQANALAVRRMIEDIYRIASPKTPFRLGNLSKDVLRQVMGTTGTIQWVKQYAQYQERGSRRDGTHKVRKYTKAGTGKGFAQGAVKQVTDNVQEYI